jgi:hypothetical protein
MHRDNFAFAFSPEWYPSSHERGLKERERQRTWKEVVVACFKVAVPTFA